MDNSDRFLQETETSPAAASDIARFLFKKAHEDLARAGSAQAAELRVHPALRNLAVCYRKAQKDGAARIPSYLEAAIENVSALLPASANLFGERRAEPRYQEQRDGGTDMSPRGGQLVPGS